jgi:hypothetical protein
MSSAKLESSARDYAESRGLEIDFAHPLGFGQDGRVWKSFHKTAVKALERSRNYTAERECYQRLLDADVTVIDGLNVPRLIDFDDRLQIIEIGIVAPPYLLDFGKAHLDARPDFPAETLAEWDEQLVELFGDDVSRVKRVLRQLTKYGIYYYDAKPANIRLRRDT